MSNRAGKMSIAPAILPTLPDARRGAPGADWAGRASERESARVLLRGAYCRRVGQYPQFPSVRMAPRSRDGSPNHPLRDRRPAAGRSGDSTPGERFRLWDLPVTVPALAPAKAMTECRASAYPRPIHADAMIGEA